MNIIEFPNLKYPKKQLYDYQLNHPNYKENLHFKSGHNLNTANECLYYDLTDKDCGVANEFVKSINCDDYKFTKVLAGGHMPPHIDPQRTGVLMIPITDEPSPIVFYDNFNKEIFSHKYVCPTLINAKKKHGVPKVKFDRVFLQINYFQPWSVLQKLRIV